MRLLKPGNDKLNPSILVWTLPRSTCNPTAWCAKHCYTKYHASPHRNQHLDQLLHLAGHPNFPLWLIREIGRAKSPTAIRVHESGDFFSPDYVRAWFKVARAHPDLHFYAFTRRTDLAGQLRRRPRNFILRFSVDPSTPRPHRLPKLDGRAYAATPPPHHHHVCPGKCDPLACRFCYTQRGDVFFPQI